MQLPLMHNKQREILAPKPGYLLALSSIVYLCILFWDEKVYSGVVSVNHIFVLFILLVAWNLFAQLGIRKSLQHNWINVGVTAFLVSVQILVFIAILPDYTTAKGADIVTCSGEWATVIETHAIDTLEPLSKFVKKGYVYLCEESASNRHYMVFFNPVSGEYYEMT